MKYKTLLKSRLGKATTLLGLGRLFLGDVEVALL